VVAGAAGGLFLLLFARTAAPGVTFVDSGELVLAARDAGVAHPPGMPLWVALAHVATRLPLGDVARRVNLSSAFFAALAVAATIWAAREAWRGRAARAEAASVGSPAAWIALALPGLLLGAGRTLWNYAGQAEVYALHTGLLALTLALVLRARTSEGWRVPLCASLAFAAALGVHHVTAILALPSLALLLFSSRRDLLAPRRLAAMAGVVLGATALIYAWLPWAASRATGLNWGDPSSLGRFVDHVSARQYRAFITPTAAGAQEELRAFADLTARELGALGGAGALALLALGAWRLWLRDRALLTALALVVAADVGYGLLYTVSDDKDAYYLPARLALALGAGAGAAALVERATARRGQVLLSLALLSLPVGSLVTHFPALDRSRDRLAEQYVADALAGAAPGGLLLTSDWQLYSPALYRRAVAGRRDDAALVDTSLLRRSWYFDALRRRGLTLLDDARGPVTEFLDDLRAWERDPALYEVDREANARINRRYHALVVGLVAAQHVAGRRAYATADVALPHSSPDPGLAEALGREFALVPVGLAFELLPRAELAGAGEARARADASGVTLDARPFVDGPRRLDADDPARAKVLPAYLAMQTNRGAYLAVRGDREGAVAAVRRALSWDAAYAPARAWLQRLGAAE
jgi:hypothetical protein